MSDEESSTPVPSGENRPSTRSGGGRPTDRDAHTKGDAGSGGRGGAERLTVSRLFRLVWWLVGALVVIAFVRGPGLRAAAAFGERGFDIGTVLDLTQSAVVTALVLVALLIGGRTLQAMGFRAHAGTVAGGGAATGTTEAPAVPPTTPIHPGVHFPASPTVSVALWLGFISVALTFGLIESLAPMLYLTDRFPMLACGVEGDGCGDLRNVLVTMFAAGIGATITTILGFLDHASNKKNFDAAYVPWYVARPLIGVLLGIVFYFVIKGGLLATVGSQAADEIDVYGLGAFAALVGLFSKRAVEKLREVFETLFSTQADYAKRQKEVVRDTAEVVDAVQDEDGS